MKLDPLNLDWDIEYEFILNNGSPIEPILIFAIPIRNRTVYMQLPFYKDLFSDGYVLLIDPYRFLSEWRKSEDDSYFSGYHQGNEQIWRADKKFSYLEAGFSKGEKISHIIINGLFYDAHTGIGFNDGLTRTIWLLSNEAEYIPVFTNTLPKAVDLKKIVGREKCSIYSCADFLNHHFGVLDQEYQRLIP
ncbi:MAG: hypothetical protein Q4C79_06525 [Neisseria sp.]|uniref:plasmid fertility inhibition factor family protein n=1 Tax=Neisseria sp. TaxID=192066 RepID=UPI0026DC6A26|nr:hypothetical protein [Neisseria sp.]MDO4248600.1 hypothetical protein [Neisseria sp.]